MDYGPCKWIFFTKLIWNERRGCNKNEEKCIQQLGNQVIVYVWEMVSMFLKTLTLWCGGKKLCQERILSALTLFQCICHSCWSRLEKYWSVFEFLLRYLAMCCREHKVRPHQESPAVQATSELQRGHVGARMGGSFSASNNARTISSWNTKSSFIICLCLSNLFPVCSKCRFFCLYYV